jgi:putative membrane protein
MTQNRSTGRHAGAEDQAPPAPDKSRSRFGGLWVGLIVAALILVLLLIFILQNSPSVRIEFLWMSGHAPLAVAILLGVAAGALLVAVPGTVRILQLRKSVRHHD